MGDWTSWTEAQVAASSEEIETWQRPDGRWHAEKRLVYDGPDCYRGHLLEDGDGETKDEAIANLKPIGD